MHGHTTPMNESAKRDAWARMPSVDGFSSGFTPAGATGVSRRAGEMTSLRHVVRAFRFRCLATWVTSLQLGVVGSTPTAATRSSAVEHENFEGSNPSPAKDAWLLVAKATIGAVAGRPSRKVTTTTSERLRSRAPSSGVRTRRPRATTAAVTSTFFAICALPLGERARRACSHARQKT